MPSFFKHVILGHVFLNFFISFIISRNCTDINFFLFNHSLKIIYNKYINSKPWISLSQALYITYIIEGIFKVKTVSYLFFNLFYSFFPQSTQLFFQCTDLKVKLFQVILQFWSYFVLFLFQFLLILLILFLHG